jgi:hypothetical protein
MGRDGSVLFAAMVADDRLRGSAEPICRQARSVSSASCAVPE